MKIKLALFNEKLGTAEVENLEEFNALFDTLRRAVVSIDSIGVSEYKRLAENAGVTFIENPNLEELARTKLSFLEYGEDESESIIIPSVEKYQEYTHVKMGNAVVSERYTFPWVASAFDSLAVYLLADGKRWSVVVEDNGGTAIQKRFQSEDEARQVYRELISKPIDIVRAVLESGLDECWD